MSMFLISELKFSLIFGRALLNENSLLMLISNKQANKKALLSCGQANIPKKMQKIKQEMMQTLNVT